METIKSKLFSSFFFLLFLFSSIHAQQMQMDHLMGTVTTKNGKEKIPGAIIFWERTSTGTSTDSVGEFMIAWPDSFPSTLIIRATGFKSKGLLFTGKNPATIKVDLSSGDTLSSVSIVERRKASEFSSINITFTENITQNGLRKAACCNLSESFETNPTVDAAVTDAVSGAKKIQLLGLDGVYSQILFENLPLIRGLSASYGLSYVPGTWIKGILVTKGTGSVVNGYESIAGQLNIDLLKPDEKADKYFVNLYGNDKGRMEANFHVNKKIGKNWGMTFLTHASTLQMRNDMNHDGFLDMPLYSQYNALGRFTWTTNKIAMGEFGARFVYDDRIGGQTSFKRDRDLGTTNFYGVGIKNQQAELFNKTGFVFASPARSLGTMFTARLHEQEMFFGLKKYSGEQKSLYANIIWQDMIGNTNHMYKAGMSFVYDDYNEKYNDSAFHRMEIVPGIFAEYTGHLSSKFTLVAGVRGDLHNLYGFQFTPRLHMKYDVAKNTAIRISGGRGFRTANIFAENSGVFASSRQLIVTENLKPEIAWNYGGSIEQKFTFLKNDATFVIDFFRTDFVNQVVADMETPGQLKFYNLKGISFANSFQADLLVEPIKSFDVRLAYKFYDVETTFSGTLKQKPLTARNRAFVNLSYALPYNKWTFDFTTKWIGATRLPATFTEGEKYSQPYFIMSTNISRKFPLFEIYSGVENILNFKQKSPILYANDPFGPRFDASQIYGPTDGRVIYAGLRFKI